MVDKIALGGGCHWCTEAVFQTLIGVENVAQGYVASNEENKSFSEAVIVSYTPNRISLKDLIEVHLHTHKSTSNHSMRGKYRSAIYTYSATQQETVVSIIKNFQKSFDYKLITKVLPFSSFRPSREQITNYYYKNPTKPFCENFINPKLKILLQIFSRLTDHQKIRHLKE